MRKYKKIYLKSLSTKGASTIEYTALIVFLLAALIAFDRYILRAFWGQWRKTGQIFGHGRQYDPRSFGEEGKGGGTVQCYFVYEDQTLTNGDWVVQPCYYDCLNSGASKATCVGQCSKGGSDPLAEYAPYCEKQFIE